MIRSLICMVCCVHEKRDPIHTGLTVKGLFRRFDFWYIGVFTYDDSIVLQLGFPRSQQESVREIRKLFLARGVSGMHSLAPVIVEERIDCLWGSRAPCPGGRYCAGVPVSEVCL